MFDWLKRRGFVAGQSPSDAFRPDAKALAMLVFYNLAVNPASYFGVPAENVAAIKERLPEPVREIFGSWGTFYVAWRLIQRAGELYGDVFRADVTALIPASFDSLLGQVEDAESIVGFFRKIFDMMDATRREGQLVAVGGGSELPIVARVAVKLIILEGEASEAKVDCALDLALALEELKGLAEPQFDDAIALTAGKKTS